MEINAYLCDNLGDFFFDLPAEMFSLHRGIIEMEHPNQPNYVVRSNHLVLNTVLQIRHKLAI